MAWDYKKKGGGKDEKHIQKLIRKKPTITEVY